MRTFIGTLGLAALIIATAGAPAAPAPSPVVAAGAASTAAPDADDRYPAFRPGTDSGGAGVALETVVTARATSIECQWWGCIPRSGCDDFWCACVEQTSSICLQNSCYIVCTPPV